MALNEHDLSADADPACRRCHGSGWEPVAGIECPCRGRYEHRVDAVLRDRNVLSERAQTVLERKLLRVLLEAKRASATYLSQAIARAVAGGARPPSVERLASFAQVDNDSAAEMMSFIDAALQTNKKGNSQ